MSDSPTDAQAESLRHLLGLLHDAQQFGTLKYLPCFLYLGSNEWSREAVHAAQEIEGLLADLEDDLRAAKHNLVATGFDVPGSWLAADVPQLYINDESPVLEITVAPPDPRIPEAIAAIQNALAKWGHDTKHDTKKKQEKRRRELNVEAIDCIRRFKDARKHDPTMPMRNVVCDYVEEMGKGSVDGIMRRLSDHPDQWKDDKKTT